MTDIKRRMILKATAVGTILGTALSAGLALPGRALADWPAEAFGAKSIGGALKNLYANSAVTESSEIKLKAPDIAENGAVVPITVSTTLPNVESIDILIEKNGRPMGANFLLGPSARPVVSTRVKVAQSGNITAIVKSGGKLYTTSKQVKVTVGGCGG